MQTDLSVCVISITYNLGFSQDKSNKIIIARELVETVRNNITIDWTLRESVQARLMTMVKRVLRKYGYPPDKQKKATETVLAQATLLCKDWIE